MTGETTDTEGSTDDAITTAGSALTRMNIRPASSKPVEAVESGKAVFEDAEAVKEAVAPISGFLDGLGIFCEIMDDVAEVRTICGIFHSAQPFNLQVHPYAKAAWNILSSVYKVSTLAI